MPRTLLSILLGIDAGIAIGFGVLSGLRPVEVYGTIIKLTPLDQHAGTVASLTSLSVFYALIGAVCLVAIGMPNPHRARLAGIMAVRHAVTGIKGFWEIGASWQVGDPMPDLIIHCSFVTLYAAFIWVEVMNTASSHRVR